MKFLTTQMNAPQSGTIVFKNDDLLASDNFIASYLSAFPRRITKVEMLVPNKVIRFTFSDGKQIKTVCHEADQFDFRFAILLAWAKYEAQDYLTREGLEIFAHQLGYFKEYDKKVKDAIALYKADCKAQEKKEREKQEAKEIRQRQAAKKARKKAERRQKMLEKSAE